MRVNREDYPADVRNEFNVMKHGYRLVRLPGFVIAYKKFWNSDKLKPYAGQYLVVSAVNENCSEVNIYKFYPPRFESDLICTIEKGV